MRVTLNTEQHERLLGGHLVMLWNTDPSNLVEPHSHVVIDDYRVFVNSAAVVETEKKPVQRLTVQIAGGASVIESTEAERKAYVLAMVYELEIAEKERMRQKLINPWIDIQHLYKRIMDGLHCTGDEAYQLLEPLFGTRLEVFRTGKFVRLMEH